MNCKCRCTSSFGSYNVSVHSEVVKVANYMLSNLHDAHGNPTFNKMFRVKYFSTSIAKSGR